MFIFLGIIKLPFKGRQKLFEIHLWKNSREFRDIPLFSLNFLRLLSFKIVQLKSKFLISLETAPSSLGKWTLQKRIFQRLWKRVQTIPWRIWSSSLWRGFMRAFEKDILPLKLWNQAPNSPSVYEKLRGPAVSWWTKKRKQYSEYLLQVAEVLSNQWVGERSWRKAVSKWLALSSSRQQFTFVQFTLQFSINQQGLLFLNEQQQQKQIAL